MTKHKTLKALKRVEERRGKQQSKMSKKKKTFVDLEKYAVEHPREFTTYYPILDSYSKLAMSDQQLYENLLPLTLDHEDLVQNNYPSDEPGLFYWPKMVHAEETNRICVRCKQPFQIGLSDIYSASLNRCYYHPRKPVGKPRKYSCCDQGLDTEGCQLSDYHVTDIMKHPRPLVKTKIKKYSKEAEQSRVFALDCEMSYTTNGLEVTKVCVIGANGLPIYNTFVKPEHKILDYNTFYSGVTASDLKDVPVSLSDVQAYLLKLFNKDSIIIGHSLNCDFAALGLVHTKVVDTSVIYRKRNNPRQKPSLKELAEDYLQHSIQDSTKGHDCVVDARASLELVLKKIETIAPRPQTVSSSTQVECSKEVSRSTQAQSPKLGTPCTLFPEVVSRSTQASSPISVSSDADAHYEEFKHRINEIIKKKNFRENEDKENETPIVFMPELMFSQNYANATNFQPCGQRFVY
ncbi:RNA exonuclease 1 homolog [Trichonephila inaurata madagascariensis]|uniref:RNA exonuclease 1 homolog n=1 Tax=Trichonephila inaurata madagascariensis TaxID=2747483 RepID=A0A8X6YCR6_9ARAC|nr:RNA exonuclease 1 homolog [Trichonephila inaurata madagascariensis]